MMKKLPNGSQIQKISVYKSLRTLMLSPKTQYNLKNAKEYFEEHLCVGDYYSECERISGEWIGNGASSSDFTAM